MRMIPETLPNWCESKAEKQLFEWFRTGKGTEGWIAMHSVRLQGLHRYKRMTELDFLLLTPLGILVLEVKGGRVHRQKQGRWSYQDRTGRITVKHEGPFEQAEGGLHAFERWLLSCPDTSTLGSELLTGWGVAMPDMPAMDWGSGVNPNQVYNLEWRGMEVREAIEKMLGVARDVSHAQPRRPPTPRECELITRQLQGEILSLPELELGRRMTRGTLDVLHDHMFEGLDTWGHYPRLMIHSPAGTDSTELITEIVRRRTQAGKLVGVLAPHGFRKTICDAPDIMESSVHVLDEDSVHRKFDILVVYRAHVIPHDMLTRAMESLVGGKACGAWVVMHDGRNRRYSVQGETLQLLDSWSIHGEVQTLVHNVCHTNGITDFVNMVCIPSLRLNSKINGPRVQLRTVLDGNWNGLQLEETLEHVLVEGGIPARQVMILVAKPHLRAPVEAHIARKYPEISVQNIMDVGEEMADVNVLVGMERLSPPEWNELVYIGLSRTRYMAILHISGPAMDDYVKTASTAFNMY